MNGAAYCHGGIPGLNHYFSRRVNVKSANCMKAMLFTAGILITYLFLHMFPASMRMASC